MSSEEVEKIKPENGPSPQISNISASATTTTTTTATSNNVSAVPATATPAPTATPTTRKRVRTGCLCCRRKHKKCDETRPVCKACVFKGEICEWPTPKLKKSTSRRDSVQSLSNGHNNLNSTTTTNSTAQHLMNNGIDKRQQLLDPNLSPVATSASTTANTNFTSMNNDLLRTTDLLPFSLNGHYHAQHLQHQQQQIQLQQLQSQQPFTRLDNRIPFNNLLNQPPPAMLTDFHHPQQQQHLQQMKRSFDTSSFNDKESVTTDQTSIFSASVLSKHPTPTNFTSPLSEAESRIHLRALLTKQVSRIKDSQTLLNSFLNNSTNFNLLSSITSSQNNYDLKNINQILTNIEEISLMKNFINNIAPKFDILHNQTFSSALPLLSKHSKALKLAMYALSSITLESYGSDFSTLRFTSSIEKPFVLFINSVNHLIKIENRSSLEALATCVILNLFNISLSEACLSRPNHLVPFFNYVNNFKITDLNSSSPTIETILCLCSLIDFNYTALTEEKLLSTLPLNSSTSSNHFQQIISLTCEISKLISTSEDGEHFTNNWEILWNRLNIWNSTKSKNLYPILEFEKSPFPNILFESSTAALANQLYHSVTILLLQQKPRSYKLKDGTMPIPWHAKQICGISLHNEMVLCGSQCLWIAGKLLTHEDEHKVIIRLLDEIEVKTGISNRFRGKHLNNYWDGKQSYI